MNSDPTPPKVALVIGNGPSVDQLDARLMARFTTFGCNHIGKKFGAWGAETDHVVITDSNRIREIGSTYAAYRGGLYVGDERYVQPPVRSIRRVLGRDFVPLRQLKKHTLARFGWLDHIRWSPLLYATVFQKGKFTFDYGQGLNFGYSVVTSAIQIAVIQGHKTILLTGVDSSYKGDKDYFSGMADQINYVNKDFTGNPRVFMEPILALMQVYLEQLGIALIDCTPGGRLRFITKGSFLDEAPFYRITRPL